MKTPHRLIRELWPLTLTLARQIVSPLVFLSAGFLLAQPCLGTPFTFENTNSLINQRSGHTATVLSNGMVLVAGGSGGNKLAELYNPATGIWKATGSLNHPRTDHT